MKVERPNEVLPVGSIIIASGETEKFLITGYGAVDTEGEKKLYDYIGCLYPDGILGQKGAYLFNQQDIVEVCHVGYKDENFKEFNDEIVELIKSKDKELEEEKQAKEMPQEKTSIFSKLRR